MSRLGDAVLVLVGLALLLLAASAGLSWTMALLVAAALAVGLRGVGRIHVRRTSTHVA